MKSKIYYILVLGLLFLHPHYTHALEPKQGFSSVLSLPKIQLEQTALVDDSQNSNTFFSAAVDIDGHISSDVDVDDDDDVSFSARKKLSIDGTARFATTQNTLPQFCDISGKFLTRYLYHLPSFHFISLRVFRL
jgi:hypothetical protein